MILKLPGVPAFLVSLGGADRNGLIKLLRHDFEKGPVYLLSVHSESKCAVMMSGQANAEAWLDGVKDMQGIECTLMSKPWHMLLITCMCVLYISVLVSLASHWSAMRGVMIGVRLYSAGWGCVRCVPA